jgi:uncharacterized repeat protein (TIGR01451 family)
MKTLFSSIFIVLLLLVPKAYSFAQQSENTVNYKVTYNFSDRKYTVWVVPEYAVPNSNNTGQFELGATAQVTLAVPKDFVISNVVNITGIWEGSPRKFGPGLTDQDWSSSLLDPDTNYYIVSKSSNETNYGTFTSGTAVSLFTFESNECLGLIRIIQPDELFITAADDIYSLNVANSFYSRSGTPQGGNQIPLEQFKAVAGTVAICTVDFVANPDNTTTPPNTEVIISVLNNDTKNGFVIIPSEHEVFIDTPPENGTASVNSNGSISYTPNVGFTGIECFAYRVCEDANLNVCRTANVCVTVPVARQIFAFDDNNITDMNASVSGNVTANDNLSSGISPFVVSVTPFSLPTNGSVILSSNGQYTYTPNNGFSGTDIFEYQTCDSGNPAVCDIAAVNIDVRNNDVTNKSPIALADKVATRTNSPISYNVLFNDGEPDGQPLIATVLTQPVNGNLSFNPDGTFLYTPTSGFVGKDSFSYEACDNATPKACDDAMVEIEVYDSNMPSQPPVANDDIFLGQPNQTMTGNVLQNDIDPSGLALTVTAIPLSPPSVGTVVINSNGGFEYTYGANFNGFDSFVYKVCNSINQCSQATVFIVEDAIVSETDISVIKLVEQSVVELNDEVTFNIIVRNNGSVNATNIVIKDILPDGLQYVSGAELVQNGEYFWTISALLPNESKTLSIRTKVVVRGRTTNTASLESVDQDDTNSTNNVSQVCVSVPVVICQGEALELSVPSNFTNISWYKDGVFFGSGNAISVSENGSYANKSPNDACPTNNCCPIVVVTEVCCNLEICIPITIKKIR